MTRRERALAQAHEAIGCAQDALRRAEVLLQTIPEHSRRDLVKARQSASVAMVKVGQAIDREVSKKRH